MSVSVWGVCSYVCVCVGVWFSIIVFGVPIRLRRSRARPSAWRGSSGGCRTLWENSQKCRRPRRSVSSFLPHFIFFVLFFFFWWVALIQIRLPPLCHMSMPAHAHNHTHKKYVPAFINTCEQAQKQEAKVLQTKRSTALARIEELGASLVTLETQISEHQRVCAALIHSCAFL